MPALVRPSAISAKTSCSRGVKAPSGSPRRAPTSRATTSGSSAEPPAATRRKVSRKLSTFVLLGIALSHSRAIPRILAVLLAIAQPLHFTAFVVLQNTYLDVAAAWLTAIGFGAAGLSLLRSSSRGNAR